MVVLRRLGLIVEITNVENRVKCFHETHLKVAFFILDKPAEFNLWAYRKSLEISQMSSLALSLIQQQNPCARFCLEFPFSAKIFLSFWQIFDLLDLFILVLMVARGYNVSDMIAPAKIDDCHSNCVLSPHETTDSSKKNKSNPKVCSFSRETQRTLVRSTCGRWTALNTTTGPQDLICCSVMIIPGYIIFLLFFLEHKQFTWCLSCLLWLLSVGRFTPKCLTINSKWVSWLLKLVSPPL